jgi:hypothetical protein
VQLRTCLTALVALALPAAIALSVAKAEDIVLPSGAELTLVKRVCTSCHALDKVTSMRLTPALWDDEVAKMVDRGAMASDAEQAQIAAYLAKNLAPLPPKP